MKKVWIFALAVATAMVACKKAPSVVNPAEPELPVDTEVDDDAAPAAIRFGSNLSKVETKAGVDEWEEHELYIYAFEADKDGNFAYDASAYIDNVMALAPTSGTQGKIDVYDENAKDINGNPIEDGFYYYKDGTPVGGSVRDFLYEFYGYYVGNEGEYATEDGDAPVPAYDGEKEAVTLDIVIDGTQDIMLAKADKEFDIEDQDVYKKDSPTELIDATRAYSAYSARRGLVPNLVFNHQLSRFQFQIKEGDPNAENVMIESISLYSKTGATLIIAPTPGLEVDEEGEDTELILKDANGDLLPTLQGSEGSWSWPTRQQIAGGETAPIRPTNTYETVGESIMAMPGNAEYKMIVKTVLLKKNEEYATSAAGTDVEFTPLQRFEAEYAVDLSETTYSPDTYGSTLTNSFVDEAFNTKWSGKAAPGFQYTVRLTVYGPEEIKINVTLNPWLDYEDEIDIDPDED